MGSHIAVATGAHPVVITRPSHQAFELLRLGFAVLPIAAGVDKFFNLLATWTQFLSPPILQALLGRMSPETFMRGVGLLEISAGILVAIRPRIGAYVVALWFAGIVMNLLMLGHNYDIVLRDLGLIVGAIALGRLSDDYDPPTLTAPAPHA